MSPDDDALTQAATLAEAFEGFSSTAYKCPAGVWTIGYGSTRDLAGRPVCAATMPVSQPTAQAMAMRDMRNALETVNANVKVRLNASQKAALLDFCYNLGSTAFRTSTLLRLLNAGDYAGAAAEFDKWDHASGRVLAGLLRRREAETKLFETTFTSPT